MLLSFVTALAGLTIMCDVLLSHRITVSRAKGAWKRNQPLGEMIGFYILKAQGSDGHLPDNLWDRSLLHESPFVPLQACESECDLPGGVPLLVVPAMYGAGKQGGYQVAVTAREQFVFVPFPPPTTE